MRHATDQQPQPPAPLPPHRDSTAGLKSQPPGYSFETDHYDLFQVIAICSGQLIVYDPARRVLGAGDALVLRKGGGFRLDSPTTGYNGVFFIQFNPTDPHFTGSPTAVAATRTMEDLIGLMLHEACFPGPTAGELLSALGRALAYAAIAAAVVCDPAGGSDVPRHDPGGGRAGGSDVPRHDPIAEALRHGIRATVQTGMSLAEVYAGIDIAKSVSYRQAQRRFRAAYGLAPKTFQTAERIREAQRLLSSTRFSVTAIAMEMGFASSQHFAAAFQAHVGVSPREYRRRGSRR